MPLHLPHGGRPTAAARRSRGRVLALTTALSAAGLLVATPGGAISLPDRTLRVSETEAGTQANGASRDPVVSTDGRTIAYATEATDLVAGDLNGPTQDVLAIDLVSGARRLVSEAVGAPEGANGASTSPALNGDGRVVAFVSFASNLVAGDVNGTADVFVRDGRGAVRLVSVAADGGFPNGPSSQPDVSADGRFVAFTSEASNLVRDDRNGKPDVFVRDLRSGTTTIVSIGDDTDSNGRSTQPAISGDGRFVVFESGASNLVPRDTNGVADVFVRQLSNKVITRVSLSTKRRQQNKSVAPPFTMQPDISRDGRFVVFDSDATNLTVGDTNKRTDVFLHDRLAGATRLISASSVNVQGNNDSFAPRIAPGGRYVTFQSFADNLVRKGDDGPREDIFVRDLAERTTAVATATNSGAPRQRELVDQVLQRPAVSNDARVVVFASTVPNLVDGDSNGTTDVFIRRLDPPDTRIVSKPSKGRPRVVVAADDPKATRYLCRLDGGEPFLCGPTVDLTTRFGKRLSVSAGGPGMLFDPEPRTITLWNDKRRPRAAVRAVRGGSLRTVRGTARDLGISGVARVDVAVSYFSGGNSCRANTGKRFRAVRCQDLVFLKAKGRSRWSLRLPRSIKGSIAIVAVATDRAGNRSRVAVRRVFLG